jgi:hypothetical protein
MAAQFVLQKPAKIRNEMRLRGGILRPEALQIAFIELVHIQAWCGSHCATPSYSGRSMPLCAEQPYLGR